MNGAIVHRLVLPYVADACSMPFFDGLRRRRRMLFMLAGLSWSSALAPGLLRESDGRVPATTLLSPWLRAMLLPTAVLGRLLSRIPTPCLPGAADGDAAG